MVQFRRSKKFGPFRITLSQRGISTSVGAGGFRVSKGADGKVRRTIRVPGTGIYDTKVISPAPHHPASRREQQSPMQPSALPPPNLPAAGWYADPKGEASLRYWDGRQWTAATNADAVPAAMKEHNCPGVVGEERGTAVGLVRGWRLFTAQLREDSAGVDQILNEIDGCPLCLLLYVHYFLGMAASNGLTIANGNRAAAIAQADKMLPDYVNKARKTM